VDQEGLFEGQSMDDFSVNFRTFKASAIQNINELLEELEASAHNVAHQALEHLHADEVIMTQGHSRTVEAFLRHAGRKRKFHVIVAESAPTYSGQTLARILAEDGIETTLITDSAIYAIMSRVNKVIIGTTVILADGGFVAALGLPRIGSTSAQAAGCQRLPCADPCRQAPLRARAGVQFALQACPAIRVLLRPGCIQQRLGSHRPHFVCPASASVCFFCVSHPATAEMANGMSCINPLFDYVPPDLIDLIVSNMFVFFDESAFLMCSAVVAMPPRTSTGC
jgi:translation initiation factor eIF-2B subunit beta